MPTMPRTGLGKLRTLFEQAREPVFVLDAQRRLVYANPAWHALAGDDAAQAPTDGEPAPLSCHTPPPEAVLGEPAGGLYRIPRGDGEPDWHRIAFWPLRDRHDAVAGWIGFVRPRDSAPSVPDSEHQRLRMELEVIRDRLRSEFGHASIIGRGPFHQRLMNQVATATATTSPVLILGEPGTGRRTVARALHAGSNRPASPFLPFDCEALPPEVLERELFEPAAAEEGIPSRLRFPEGSSVLLIEGLRLPRDLQSRLTAALDGRVRLIATSALDPDRARAQALIRGEFYFALTTLVIRLAPLRERLDELPLLAQHGLERIRERTNRPVAGFDPRALGSLAAHDWPGNLRELMRVIEAAHANARGALIQVEDIPAAIRGHLGAAYLPPSQPPPVTPLDATLLALERRLIEQALQRARNNKSRAAELLDISRPRLYRRIKELNLPDGPDASDDDDDADTEAVNIE